MNNQSSINSIDDPEDGDTDDVVNCDAIDGILGDGQRTYLILSTIAPLFVIALAWTVRRKKDGKRPGCPTPIPVIDPCRRRWVYAIFWVMAAYECLQFVIDHEGLIISPRCFQLWAKPIVVLCNVFLYALLHYPIVTGFSTDTPIGYLISTIWTCIILGLRTEEVFNFEDEYPMAKRAADVFENMPSMVCMYTLAIYLIYQTAMTFKAVYQKTMKFYEPVDRQLEFNTLPESLYVRELFKRRDPPQKQNFTFLQKLKETVTYRNIPHFRYSQTIISTLAIGMIFVFYTLYGYFYGVHFAIPEMKEGARNLTKSLAIAFNFEEENLKMVEVYIGDSLIYSLVVSGVIVTLLQLFLFATFLPSYRRDIIGAYKGNYDHIAPPVNAPHAYFNSAISYAGNQAVMFVWGCTLQLLLSFVVTLAIAWIIFVPLIYGFGDWIINHVITILPALGITLGLMIAQRVCVARFFTQDRGTSMAVKNRRGYSNLAYLGFFKSLLTGLVGALNRLVYSTVFGVILLSRCDAPVISRRVERFDASFNLYVSFIHLENAHLNPCVITFVNIVLERVRQNKKGSQQTDDGGDSAEKPSIFVVTNQATIISSPTPLGKAPVDESCRDDSSRKNNDGQSNCSVNNNERSFDEVDCKGPQFDTELGIRAVHPASDGTNQSSTPISMGKNKVTNVASSFTVRFKWLLAYTLVRNPRLVADRKSSVIAQRLAQKTK